MTKTIKTYVELADLTGVHLECEHCHSSLTIPFQRLDRGIPAKCPNCNEDWGKRENYMSRNDDPIPQNHLSRDGRCAETPAARWSHINRSKDQLRGFRPRFFRKGLERRFSHLAGDLSIGETTIHDAPEVRRNYAL
jgi:hypothetical protein